MFLFSTFIISIKRRDTWPCATLLPFWQILEREMEFCNFQILSNFRRVVVFSFTWNVLFLDNAVSCVHPLFCPSCCCVTWCVAFCNSFLFLCFVMLGKISCNAFSYSWMEAFSFSSPEISSNQPNNIVTTLRWTRLSSWHGVVSAEYVILWCDMVLVYITPGNPWYQSQ